MNRFFKLLLVAGLIALIPMAIAFAARTSDSWTWNGSVLSPQLRDSAVPDVTVANITATGTTTGFTASGAAPDDATYITQTADGDLSAEQALSTLASGIMRVATTTGVITALTDSAGIAANISDETGSGALVFGTSPTFVTPALGTPASGVATNVTGTAAGLTAGNVTTNANLTGHVTSTGNAAVLGSFTTAQLSTAISDGLVCTSDSTNTFTNKTFDANGTGNSLSNVDIADWANGTDGEIPTWDAAGAPTTVAVGTATHVLTSNGVGAAPTFQAAAGGGATIELDNLGTVAINTSLISDTDSTDDLGSTGVAWANVYADAIKSITGNPLTLTPIAGQDLIVELETTGDFVVNDTDIVSDTSAGGVGIGVIPLARLHIKHNTGDLTEGLRIQGLTDATAHFTEQSGTGAFEIYTDSTQPLILNNTSGGNVGIMTVAPANPLAVNRAAGDGVIVDFESADTVEGTISIAGNTTSYNAFTGSHYAIISETIERGMLVSLTGENGNFHDNPKSEILYGVAPSTVANDSKILGSYLSLQNPSDPVSPDNPHLVMSVGNGDMWVADNGENITRGDYLISSSVKGHAMKDKGDYEVSYVIARVAEDIDWSTVKETVGGVKHKKVSVLFESFTNMSGLAETVQELQAQIDELKTICRAN